MRAVVMSDTHIGDALRSNLDPQLLDAVRAADVVLHAGDITGAKLLERLRSLTAVHAVLGNNDVGLAGTLPETLELDLEGITVAVVHDAGPRRGRPERLERRFPDADLVVFGHSHQPEDLTSAGGTRVFNPGSPTQRRRAPSRSYGWLEIEQGVITKLDLVELDRR